MSARLVVAIAALFAAAAYSPAHGQSAAAACSPGMHQVTVSGRPGFRFCGPATAVVRVSGRTLRFSNGLCQRAAGAFTVNIGTSVPALRTGKPLYFGITTHTARPGKQLNAALGFTNSGRGYAVADQFVVLGPGLGSGTFSGRVLGTTTRIAGSFKC
jgi:hypothetical protein